MVAPAKSDKSRSVPVAKKVNTSMIISVITPVLIETRTHHYQTCSTDQQGQEGTEVEWNHIIERSITEERSPQGTRDRQAPRARAKRA